MEQSGSAAAELVRHLHGLNHSQANHALPRLSYGEQLAPIAEQQANAIDLAARAAALGYELRPQGGGAAMHRSTSAMELPQAGPSLKLSQPAMLVGTVAALQEDNSQLKSQWKHDVSRLERELDELRSAAAWALPHLQESVEPIPTLELSRSMGGGGAGGGGRENLFKSGAMTERVSYHAPPSLNLEGVSQKTIPALMTERGSMHDRNRYGVQMPPGGSMTERISRPGDNQDASGVLTEALLAQMAEAEAKQPLMRPRSNHSNETRSRSDRHPRFFGVAEDHGPLNPFQTGMPVSEAPMFAPRGSSTSYCNSSVDEAPLLAPRGGSAGPYSVDEQLRLRDEVVRELQESLKEAQAENAKLREEKEVCEAAHTRDVAALEAMLQQVTEENRQLQEQLLTATQTPLNVSAGNDSSMQKGKLLIKHEGSVYPPTQQSFDAKSFSDSQSRAASVWSRTEPDMERSGEFERLQLSFGAMGPMR